MPSIKRVGCPRCGAVLRGRGVGYCWWCKKYQSVCVVTESPGELWLMSQGALDVPRVDWRTAIGCGSSVAVGVVGSAVAAETSESVGGLCSSSSGDMHVSSLMIDSDAESILDVLGNFEMSVSPISSDSDAQTLEVLRYSSRSYEELARARVVCALAVLLHSDSLAGIFSCCNDYCRLAFSSRGLYREGLLVPLYRHWYEDLRDHAFEAYIQERADAQARAVAESLEDIDVLCSSCGLRPPDDHSVSHVVCARCAMSVGGCGMRCVF